MARKGSFSDLNIPVDGDKKCIGRILERLAECKLAPTHISAYNSCRVRVNIQMDTKERHSARKFVSRRKLM